MVMKQEYPFCKTMKAYKPSDFEDEWTKRQEALEWNPEDEELMKECFDIANEGVPCSNGNKNMLA